MKNARKHNFLINLIKETQFGHGLGTSRVWDAIQADNKQIFEKYFFIILKYFDQVQAIKNECPTNKVNPRNFIKLNELSVPKDIIP